MPETTPEETSMIRFTCPNCGTALKVLADRAGQEVQCPKCDHPLSAPVTDHDESPRRMLPAQKVSADGNRSQTEASWYYSAGGTRQGPVSEHELRALAADGTVKPSDLVWCKGMSGWVSAAEVEGLFPEDLPPPLPGDEAPPLPNKAARLKKAQPDEEPIATWEGWQVWVYSIISLTLFGFYLIPSWAKSMGRITGKPRMPFGALLALGICTLGLALIVVEVVYAFDLARHGQQTGKQGSNPQLGGWVLGLNVVALVWAVTTSGIGFLLGGEVLGILATWLVQAEINRYAEDAD